MGKISKKIDLTIKSSADVIKYGLGRRGVGIYGLEEFGEKESGSVGLELKWSNVPLDFGLVGE